MINKNLKSVAFVSSIALSSAAVFAAVPADYEQFQPILAESKLQASDPEGKSGNKAEYAADSNFAGLELKDVFFVDEDSEALVFKMKGYKNRSEVRILDNFDTSLPDTFYRLSADILPINPQAAVAMSDGKNDAMTFLQVHNSGDGTSARGTSGEGYIPHPLVRVVYEAERSGKTDHYWAIIKNNAMDCGSKSGNKEKVECKEAYIKLDLGQVDLVKPTHFDIIVGDSKLVIDRDGETVVNHDISYWSEKFSYFKAGVYNQFKNGTSEAHFYSLEYSIDKK